MSTPWDHKLLFFAPLALFGVLALAAGLFSLVIERAERRRARLYAPRRRAWHFRPVVIEGGKVEPAPPAEAAPLAAPPPTRRTVSS